MKKNLLFIAIILTAAASSCVKDRIPPAAAVVVVPASDTLMYYWTFNNADSTDHSADFAINGNNAYFSYSASYIDYTVGSSLNLINGTDSGSCLRVRNPSQTLTFAMPTTGYDSVALSFAVQSSSSGPSENLISYTTDGVTYINTGLTAASFAVTTTFSLVTFDFSGIPNVKNNPKFGVMITFNNNNTGTSGNDRFDNVSLSGITIINE
jgi:hypothetical protein